MIIIITITIIIIALIPHLSYCLFLICLTTSCTHLYKHLPQAQHTRNLYDLNRCLGAIPNLNRLYWRADLVERSSQLSFVARGTQHPNNNQDTRGRRRRKRQNEGKHILTNFFPKRADGNKIVQATVT